MLLMRRYKILIDKQRCKDKTLDKEHTNQVRLVVVDKALLKQSTANLSTDDAKQLNTLMGTIFNDKLKADREKDKGKKKPAKKGAVSQGKATGRCNDYDDDW